MGSRLYAWRGDNFSILEIIEIYKKETGETLARGTLYNRIRARGGCIDSALNFKHKNWPEKLHDCPNGKQLSHNEIANFLGICVQTWYSRLALNGGNIAKAWDLGKNVTDTGATTRGLKSPKKYKWRGKWWTLPEIIAQNDKDGGKKISTSTLRWRISSRGTVAKALSLKPRNSWRAAKKHLCPDGVKRDHRGIAKHLGIPDSRWQSRFHSQGRNITKAFNYTPTKKEIVKKTVKPVKIAQKVATTIVTKETTEALRVQRALDALPSATKYEADLYG